MFDTVRLKATGIMNFPIDRFENVERKVYLCDSSETLLSVYFIKGINKLPFIKYQENDNSLEIEVSIPKYLYGENVTLLKQNDIDVFFTQLSDQLYSLCKVDIDKSEWRAKRIDVCWNFQVGNKLTDYMKQLSLKKIPRMNTVTYNQVETVIFQNKSKRIQFYDKEKECRDKKCSPEVIERAWGLIRMEVSPPDYEMKEYTTSRQAEKLLTKEFFMFVTRKIIPHLDFQIVNEHGITSDWIMSHSINKVETLIGFCELMQIYGMGGIRGFYKESTLDNRFKLLEIIEETKTLPRLEIDYLAL
jgi:hypothetical protein